MSDKEWLKRYFTMHRNKELLHCHIDSHYGHMEDWDPWKANSRY